MNAAEEARTIGALARMIRRRRGLSLEVVAGLAGIPAQYLSMLERGLRGFTRRGLIEDLANALGCSVADLTGQPYLPPGRASANALTTLPSIRLALNDFGRPRRIRRLSVDEVLGTVVAEFDIMAVRGPAPEGPPCCRTRR